MCCPGISKDVQGRKLWVSTEHCVQWWLFPANCKNNGCQRSETVTITTLSSFINTIIITNALHAISLSRVFQGKNNPQTCRLHHVESFRMQSAQKQQGLGDLESAIATNNGEPITRPNIIIVIFWVHHETKYLCCHFSGKHQILFSLDFLSLSVLIFSVWWFRERKERHWLVTIFYLQTRVTYMYYRALVTSRSACFTNHPICKTSWSLTKMAQYDWR